MKENKIFIVIVIVVLILGILGYVSYLTFYQSIPLSEKTKVCERVCHYKLSEEGEMYLGAHLGGYEYSYWIFQPKNEKGEVIVSWGVNKKFFSQGECTDFCLSRPIDPNWK